MNFNALFSNRTLRFWLTVILLAWVLGTLGLGWLVKSVVFLLAAVVIAPILVLVGLFFWLRGSLVQAPCPVCNFEFASLNNSKTRCPNCGEALQVVDRQLIRQTLPGTIDVSAVEVSYQALEDQG